MRKLIENRVLTNLLTLLVLVTGAYAYLHLPREQDPEVNFNWVQVVTLLPGASAEDVEREVTSPLEDGVRRVGDLKFVSSTSREGVSNILVRFNDVDEKTFDKRVSDLRRELTNKYQAELPPQAREPDLLEIKSSNAFPSATVVLAGPAEDAALFHTAERLKKSLERLPGTDTVFVIGGRTPQLQVAFDPVRLEALEVPPTLVADSVRAHFRDTAAGAAEVGSQEWLVRLTGRKNDPDHLAELPLVRGDTVIPLGAVAQVERGHAAPDHRARFGGRPAVMLQITKKAHASTVELLEDIKTLVRVEQGGLIAQGLTLTLADDQTERIRSSLAMMEENALYGLVLMFFTTWLFLGWKLSLLNATVIPFTLAGVFAVMAATGMSLNTSVLIAILIALGMVVDGSVVVLDAVYVRLQRGSGTLKAVLKGLHEVRAPVLVSALTAVMTFFPLLLMPGILGQFMAVLPVVIGLALAISLIDAFWLLPAHILEFRVNFRAPSRAQAMRARVTKWLVNGYYRLLLRVLKRPALSALAALSLMATAGLLVAQGQVRADFFADDPIRLFYVNVEMAPGTRLGETLDMTERVERAVRAHLRGNEARSVVSYAGFLVTAKDPQTAPHLGQVLVSLRPHGEGGREVGAVVEGMRAAAQAVPGPVKVSFLTRSSGPPVAKAIEIKVRGDDYGAVRRAADELKSYLGGLPAVRNLSDDDSTGKMELRLRPDTAAAQRAQISPEELNRVLRLYFDGEIAGELHDGGEKVEVQVAARTIDADDVDGLLDRSLALPGGGTIALADLVRAEREAGRGNIRHYNFQRTITLEGDLDKAAMNSVEVNRLAQDHWAAIGARHPGVSLDFSGELDDIKESVDALMVLMLIGVGLIYVILGAQFRSYAQPLVIFVALPLAFTGVVFGLYVSDNPLSLYTLYGVVALSGVIISTAIVLIDAINARRLAGMDPLQAILQAATRRLMPILLTALTTFVDLIPLAFGWGGKSLIWSPMATAIVWGLAISTLLTLFFLPLLYFLVAGRGRALPVRRGAEKAPGRVVPPADYQPF